MVKFVVSPDIQHAINEYNKRKGLSEGDDGYINPASIAIEHLKLAHMASTLQTADDPNDKLKYSLSHMVKTASLYVEPIQKPKPVRLAFNTLILESRVPSKNGRTSTASGREGVQCNDCKCQTYSKDIAVF